MSVLSTKAASAARFLASRAGIIGVTHERGTQRILMGRTPYRVLISTARSHNRTQELLAALRGHLRGSFIITTYGAERTEDFIVSMTLEEFAPLLEAHYNTVVLPRLKEGEQSAS